MLLVWVDVNPAVQFEADRWYESEHFPERITESGYLRARRFRALSGSPAHMGILEATTPEALASDGYQKVTANINARSRRMREAFQRIIRSTHQLISSSGTTDGGVFLCSRLDFAGADQRAGFERWAQTQLTDWLSEHPQVLSGHALLGAPEVRQQMDGFRATGQADESADGVLLLEMGRPSDATDTLLAQLAVEGWAHRGIDTRAVDTGLYQLMFDITHEQLMPEIESFQRTEAAC